jgi:hypothetical protein
MSLAVLIPYRPDNPHRERIHAYTSAAWARIGVERVYADDGLEGVFSLTRAANRARRATDADAVLVYSVDALPPPVETLEALARDLGAGLPWSVVFEGQRRYTPEQTEALLDPMSHEPVGPPEGELCEGREAIIAVRTDVWDAVRGMDERFRGWGPEDRAFHQVLSTLYTAGCDVPMGGLFASLYHPDAPRTSYRANAKLWAKYEPHTSRGAMRHFYLSRP